MIQKILVVDDLSLLLNFVDFKKTLECVNRQYGKYSDAMEVQTALLTLNNVFTAIADAPLE